MQEINSPRASCVDAQVQKYSRAVIQHDNPSSVHHQQREMALSHKTD